MFRRSLLIAVAATLALACPGAAQPRPFNPEPLLAEAITAARQRAYRSSQVDWPALEARVRAKAAGAQDALDLLPAYVVLLNGLGDGHSYVQPAPGQAAAYEQRHGRGYYIAADVKRSKPPLTSTFAGRKAPDSRLLAVRPSVQAQLLIVPSFGGTRAEAQAYADDLFQAFAASAGTVCGYVLDLRGNTGGNMWPMVTGLSPLLGDSMALGKQDAEGDPYVYAYLTGGAAIIASGGGQGNKIQAVQGWRNLGLVQAPVAILQDDAVMSSGEAVLAAFAGRPNTRTFGSRSRGLASANAGYRLADGTILQITVGMMTDRAGRTYPDGFLPDEPVEAGPGQPGDPDDAAVEAAKSWLGRQPDCRKN